MRAKRRTITAYFLTAFSMAVFFIFCHTGASGYVEQVFETGTVNMTDVAEDEAGLSDFNFLKEKTIIALRKGLSRFLFAGEIYKKDFKEADEKDSLRESCVFEFSKDTKKSDTIYLNSAVLKKRYKALPDFDYRSQKLSFGFKRHKKGFSLSSGFKFFNYDYLSSDKDFIKYGPVFEAKKYFFNKRLVPSFSCSAYRHDKKNSPDRLHSSYRLASVFKPGSDYFRSIEAGYAYIQDSARDQDREIDYNYGLKKFFVRTRHRYKKIGFSPFWQIHKKKYTGYAYDWSGYEAGASGYIDITEYFKAKMNFNFRRRKYLQLPQYTSKRYSFSPGVSYSKIKDCNYSCSCGIDVYDYPFSQTYDRKRYWLEIGLNKYLRNDFRFLIRLKNTKTGYKSGPSRIGFVLSMKGIFSF